MVFFAAKEHNFLVPITRQHMEVVITVAGSAALVGISAASTRTERNVLSLYIERLQETHSAPTVKQHLAAIRMLFDWFVVGQVLPVNPASAVRGPRHVTRRGKTPVLNTQEARHLLD